MSDHHNREILSCAIRVLEGDHHGHHSEDGGSIFCESAGSRWKSSKCLQNWAKQIDASYFARPFRSLLMKKRTRTHRTPTKYKPRTIDQYWHKSGTCGITSRATLRTLQFVFAARVAGIYGVESAQATKSKSHAHIRVRFLPWFTCSETKIFIGNRSTSESRTIVSKEVEMNTIPELVYLPPATPHRAKIVVCNTDITITKAKQIWR